MHPITFTRGRPGALAPAALLLALCLLAVGVQAMTDPTDTAALVTGPALSADGNQTAPAGYETPIVVNPADQLDPAIFGTRVVWQDWRNSVFNPQHPLPESEGDIYSYNLTSHLELPEGASTSSRGIIVPNDYDPAISSAGIFWVFAGFSDATIENELHGRTLAGEGYGITQTGEPVYRDILDLVIDGDTLVFILKDSSDNYHLVRYEATLNEYFTDRTTPNEIRSPDISGHNLVWQEFDGNDWNVFLLNLSQGSPVALANVPGDQVAPAVDGNRVVWADNRSGNWDLFTADLSLPNPAGVPLVVAPGDQTNPQLSGDRVAWQDNRSGNWDIWLGSLSGGAAGPITTANDDQILPAVDGDCIVWQDHRNGNWDIYMFTVSPTTPPPAPTPAPLVITAPGTYAVTADGYDGNATPIEIRSSDVVLDGGGHVVDGSGQPGSSGVLIAGAGPLTNVVVRNVRLTNWETGIRAENAANSTIEASGIAHNQQGVVLENARDVQVREDQVTANDYTGVLVSNSSNTTVRANDVSKTGDGFEHHGLSTEELFTFAIALSGSAGTGISGNDLGAPGGLDLVRSPATRMTGNQITAGLGILSLSTDGSENFVAFNNVFRNSVYLWPSPLSATWNTTRSPGPNIVGGPQIGGNFWANFDGTGFSETHPDANHDGFCDLSFDFGGETDFLPLAVWTGPGNVSTPFKPHAAPGRVQAEDYDLGGEGVAYHDTDAGNNGGVYRHDDVDIEQTAGLATPNVGWIRSSEYLVYTVNVTAAGNYTLTARVASPNSGRTMALSAGGTTLAIIAVPNTGSFATFTNVTIPVTLTAGTHTLKLTFTGDGQNLDWFELTPVVPTPGGPTPFKPLFIPGTIQAEDYNLGGEGVAYHDTDAGNNGGIYRHDDVDIEQTAGLATPNVGWIRSSEYLTYTATVQSAGAYTMTARVASPNSGRTAALSVDGAPVATIAVPNTGSFAPFRTVEMPVTLSAGSHVLKLTFQGDGQNLDWIEFSSGVVTTTPTTPALSGASFVAAPLTAPHGDAVKFTLTPAGGKSISAVLWSFDAPAHLNTWNSRAVNPTFFYPTAGTFSPLVKITYTDGSSETVERTGYIRAT